MTHSENEPPRTTDAIFLEPPVFESQIDESLGTLQDAPLSKKALQRQRERIRLEKIATGELPDSPIPTPRIARRRDE